MQSSDNTGHIDGANQGTVFRKSVGQYFVHTDHKTVVCSISSRLRKQLLYPIAAPSSIRPHVVAVEDIRTVDPVAIGDQVHFITVGDGTGMITEVLTRRSKLARMAAGEKPIEQVIVANVDQIIPMFAVVQPRPSWGLLDRYLASAEAAELPVLICITKMDLAKGTRIMEVVDIYRKIGYPLVLTSALTGEGVEAFREALEDRVSVFVGKSGVGKTTLLNAIQPELGLRVAEVSHLTGKGKHTTSHLEMFPLDFGGSVVDTPGMREFGLWEHSEWDLAMLFPEMRPYVGKCHFRASCWHEHEPGCAIKEAVKAGHISEMRYRSYLRMEEASA